MSKELVARALRALDPYGQGDSTAALIRAVDAQYGEGYDRHKGLTAVLRDTPGWEIVGRACTACPGTDQIDHSPNCTHWNTRVALLALCRDILGEKECS